MTSADTREAGATILLYHGVAGAPSAGIENFSGKHLLVDKFERQMRYLKEETTVLSLRELVRRLADVRPLPDRAVAVTFDALPVLERHGVPATFFIATGFVGTSRRFWVDEVEHAIDRTSRPAVELRLDGVPWRARPLAMRSSRRWPRRPVWRGAETTSRITRCSAGTTSGRSISPHAGRSAATR